MVSELQEEVQIALGKALDELRVRKLPFRVVSDFRKSWEQLLSFMQSRASLEIINLWRLFWEVRPISLAESKTWTTNCNGITLKSKHQSGRAVDIVPVEGDRPVWPPHDDPRWAEIAEVMKMFGFSWGGDWPEPEKDPPHYEYT